MLEVNFAPEDLNLSAGTYFSSSGEHPAFDHCARGLGQSTSTSWRGWSNVHSKSTLESDRAIAYCLLRATLGLKIFIHGVSRVLVGTGKFAASLVAMFHNTLLAAAARTHIRAYAAVAGSDRGAASPARSLDAFCIGWRSLADLCAYVRYHASPGLGNGRTAINIRIYLLWATCLMRVEHSGILRVAEPEPEEALKRMSVLSTSFRKSRPQHRISCSEI
jgi:hypothetical protein